MVFAESIFVYVWVEQQILFYVQHQHNQHAQLCLYSILACEVGTFLKSSSLAWNFDRILIVIFSSLKCHKYSKMVKCLSKYVTVVYVTQNYFVSMSI